MRKFQVNGMTCDACRMRVERAVSRVPGVEKCSVSLLTKSMVLQGTASDKEIIKAVKDAGYSASLQNIANQKALSENGFFGEEIAFLKKRLFSSLVFLILLLYLSMSGMIGLPLPATLKDNPFLSGIIQMVLSAIIIVINRRFFISGIKSAARLVPNMDTLVSLGAGVSFIWSVFVLLRMKSGIEGDLYFESCSMILCFITVGKLFEAKSKGKTTNAINSLYKLAPKTAHIIIDGKEMTIPVSEMKKGEIFSVRPGESIPADGVVIEGESAVNESAITGESIPVDKSVGSRVISATMNESGYLLCRATDVGEDTAIAKIIRMVSDAATTKAPIAKTADKVSGVFVPFVIAAAVITFACWLILGKASAFALERAISVIVISCPCALGLATPVAIMVGSGKGAKNGVLFKTATSLEETGKIKIAVFDKTGTVTKGKPEVVRLCAFGKTDEKTLLSAALSLEKRSEHPLAAAIVDYAERSGAKAFDISDFKAIAGFGVTAKSGSEEYFGGSVKFISEKMPIDALFSEKASEFAESGETPVVFAKSGEILGIISISDAVKPDSAKAISELENMGIRTVMLTGDDIKTASKIGENAGIKHIAANLLPDEKALVVKALREKGKLAMTGDGINDAPALTSADVGIAIGAGTDVAIDAADVVLVGGSLSDVVLAVKLSRKTLHNIKENLFWAFFYNVLCIPLAAGVYSGILGWELSPAIAALSMSLSSFCVVANALRLDFMNIGSKKYGKIKSVADEEIAFVLDAVKKKSEENVMTKTLVIEGMMCPHCEAHTKSALEAISGVEKATASHAEKKAVVTLSHPVEDEILIKAVENAGYKVLSVK